MGRRSMPPQTSRPTSPSRFHLPNIIRSSSERALANSSRLKRQSSFLHHHHQHVTMPEDITRRIQQRHHSRTVVDDDEEDDDDTQLRALPARMSTMMVVRHLEGPSTSSKKGPHDDIDDEDDDEDDDIRGSSLFLSDRSASDMVLLHQQHRLEPTQSSSPSPPQRRVSFGVCQVRSYRQVLGDHPCCETGCPLSLGWEYHVEETMDVDELNPTSIVANDGDKRPCPKLTLEERRARLGGACSDADIRRIARRRHRDRECAARSAKGFFSCGASSSSATRKCHNKSKASAATATPRSNATVEDSEEEEYDASVPTSTTVQEQ